MNISKGDLFALERAYEMLVRLVDSGDADLTSNATDRLDFNAIHEQLGDPKPAKSK